MKPLWTGPTGFGLINTPVKLYSATESSDVDLDMLDKKDHSHIKYLHVNEKTGKEVAWNNIVKGYNTGSKYVVLDELDFEKAGAEKTKLIEITDFVNLEAIDSVYYEMPYYLAPEKSGIRPYALLREALIKTKRAGVASFVMRNKEHLAILSVSGNAIF